MGSRGPSGPGYGSRPVRIWGEHVSHRHLSPKNLINALLTLTVLLPSVFWVASLRRRCGTLDGGASSVGCGLYASHPDALLHLLFFANVTVGFWIVGLVQRSFWLIDPYWTLFPPLAAAFYGSRADRPFAASDQFAVALALLLVWSARLTYSYFRRENWKFGEREDWRYTDMAKAHGKHWWWMSFFAVGLAQQFMLCPLVYPFRALSESLGSEWSALDLVAAAGSSIGILVSWTADAQLHRYCNSGPYREGGSKPPVLSSGLWYLSRHPNYVGEQVFWWSLALFAVAREDYIALVGPAINSLVLLQVTHMTEAHMLGTWKSERRKREYREYARRTPAWVPLLPTTIFPTYQKEGRSD